MSRIRNAAPLLILSTLLTGCALSRSADQSTGLTGGSAVAVTGRVMGGQQPVAGATIQLYTVGTTGIASASAPLIGSTVLTTAGGNFTITGAYDCTNATEVYITASGGDSGSGTNSALSMMAALGSCATLKANAATTFININELTTVAAAYSFAPFASSYKNVGATGSNPAGLLTAFTTSTALVSTASGQIAKPAAGITLPVNRLNSLADIVGACVNSTGATSSGCSTLFTVTGAVNTADAALFIAHNPGLPAVTALYSLPTPSSPFQPPVSGQPNDFTLAINYAGADLASPYGIALDAAGNAWVTNEAGTTVSKLPAPSPTFASQSIAANLVSPHGVSIDRSGNVWIANTGANSVVELSSAGNVLSAAGFTGGGISAPVAIATDGSGNAYVANFAGNSVTVLSPAGAATSQLTSSLSAPSGIALDNAGNIAVANAGNGSICVFTRAGALRFCPTDGTLFGSTGLAVSPNGALAMSGSTTGASVSGAFTLASTSGTVSTGSPVVAVGGLALPLAVAYDASGTAWFANSTSVSAFTAASAITPATGYGTLNLPQGLAIDASGNLWTANSGDNSVSIFIGIAAPTATPIAAGVNP